MQVQVLLDASKCGIQIPDAMQQLAIAYIAHGYTAECPHSVHKAAKILSQLAAVQQQASNPSPSMQRNGGSGRASRASARLRGSSSDSVGTQGAVNEGPDVSVDRAVCAVLLGDMRQAAALLHLGPGQEDQMDPELLFFVQSKVR